MLLESLFCLGTRQDQEAAAESQQLRFSVGSDTAELRWLQLPDASLHQCKTASDPELRAKEEQALSGGLPRDRGTEVGMTRLFQG